MSEPCEPSAPPAPEHGWLPSSLHLSAPRKPRRGEWTREKMVRFLRELAATQCVSAAARAVGMSRTSAYRLRNRMQDTPFALGWEVALEMGLHQLAHVLMDRAINGVEVPHYYHGELVGTTRRFDNRLAQWLLANPWRVGRQQVAREWSAKDFEALLERIEWDSLVWHEEDPQPGPGWPNSDIYDADIEQDRFLRHESWYAAEAEWDSNKRGAKPADKW